MNQRRNPHCVGSDRSNPGPALRRTDVAGGKRKSWSWSRRSAAIRENVDCFHQEGRGVESVQLSDMHVQIDASKNTAVASYRLLVKTRSAKGVVSDESFQESHVWFKHNGEWKVVHRHDSPAPRTT